MSMSHDEMIAVIAADRDGKIVEARSYPDFGPGNPWTECTDEPSWNFDEVEYRIKPEPPKPREWWIHVPVVHASTRDIFPCPQSYVPDGEKEIHVREVLPDEEGKA